jgi:hypothetical protein
MAKTFFQKYGQSELGTTKLIISGQAAGFRGPLQKMIDVSVDDAGACPVIVSARVEYQQDAGGAAQIGGPIVGIVQWGIGGGENQVEFDIPSARLAQNVAPVGVDANFQPMTNIGNGVQVYLGGASHVSVYVRHDGQMSPLTNPGVNNIGATVPAKVIVHIQPAESGGRPPVERTIFAVGSAANPAPDQLIPGGLVNISIPPFAKSVRIQRRAGNLPVDLWFSNNFGVNYRRTSLGVNDEGPVAIDAASEQLRIFNTGAVNIEYLQAVFDVTPI